MGKEPKKRTNKSKDNLRITPITRNGKTVYAIEKLVFKFLFISLWDTVTDYVVTPASPMEYNTLEKASKRLSAL